jgi:hypothetical protein
LTVFWKKLFVVSLYFFHHRILQASLAVFFFFGYMIDVIFGTSLTFEFDPDADNWRRKTDPQS